MHAEISYDLVMTDDMSFVEGTYRLAGEDWQVFIFSPDDSIAQPQIVTSHWASGVTGLFVKWPATRELNKHAVLETLSTHLGVATGSEVRGPDSIRLR